jgi:hypothetical protein
MIFDILYFLIFVLFLRRAKTASFSFSLDILILRKSLRKAENQNDKEKEMISILKSQHTYFKSLIKRVTRRVT